MRNVIIPGTEGFDLADLLVVCVTFAVLAMVALA